MTPDQRERLEAMVAPGQETLDLSPNDVETIKAVLKELDGEQVLHESWAEDIEHIERLAGAREGEHIQEVVTRLVAENARLLVIEEDCAHAKGVLGAHEGESCEAAAREVAHEVNVAKDERQSWSKLLDPAPTIRRLEEELAAALHWEDVKDEWTDAIDAAHPMKGGSHDKYAMAMDMVSHRHSKGTLVELVNWLLVERNAAKVGQGGAEARERETVSLASSELVASNTESDRLRAALVTIGQWDCLNPPRTDLLGDLAWLRILVDETLAPAKTPDGKSLARRFVDTLTQRFVCPDCGWAVKADEDGCCSTCGRDCAIVAVLVEPEDMARACTNGCGECEARGSRCMCACHQNPLTDEVARLKAIINTPELASFSTGVALEAVHQRERWGSGHDAGKAPSDWYWLLGFLGGKALAAHIAGNVEKALHHTISSAAVLANWHAAIAGTHTGDAAWNRGTEMNAPARVALFRNDFGAGVVMSESSERGADVTGPFDYVRAEAFDDLFHALSALVESLPRCEDHGRPATRAWSRGTKRYCDECGHGPKACMGRWPEKTEVPEYPRAPAVRSAIALLKKLQAEHALETGAFL